MQNETFEAYALGGLGAARGVYEEYLEPNLELAALAGVVAVATVVGASQFYIRRAIDVIQSK